MVPSPPVERVQAITPPDHQQEDQSGLRRLLSRGNPADEAHVERLQRPFQGTRHIVVLGCTGGAGQTVTALMVGHTFAQYCGEPIVALDVNPGPGALARRTKIDSHENLTSLIAHADTIGQDGRLERRSLVYTEYFASGTQPTAECDIHASRGIFGAIATAFRGTDEQPASRVEDTGLPASQTSSVAAAEPTSGTVEEAPKPKKKRGFWSRVFGIGRDDDKDEDEKKEKKR